MFLYLRYTLLYLDYCHRATQHGTVTNAVDSILRIIGTEEGSTTTVEKLKTMKPYIIGLATVGQRVRNNY